MKRLDKIKFWLQSSFQLLVVIAGGFAIFRAEWITVAIALGALVISFLPSIIEHRYKVDVPNDFEVVVVVFLYLSLYLGELQGFYQLFWWWDLFLHGLSGFIIGAVGLSLVYYLNQERVSVQLSPGFIVLFAFSFSVALGVVWEIFEFGMDSFFGLNMQKSGLVDTMWDLIVDVLGSALVALIGYIYIKEDPHLVDKLEKKFR